MAQVISITICCQKTRVFLKIGLRENGRTLWVTRCAFFIWLLGFNKLVHRQHLIKNEKEEEFFGTGF